MSKKFPKSMSKKRKKINKEKANNPKILKRIMKAVHRKRNISGQKNFKRC